MIDLTVAQTVNKLNKSFKNIHAPDIKSLHHFRIQSKRLRYQREFISPDITHDKEIIYLRGLQDEIGTFLDNRVLKSKLEKFLKE